jgi:cytochrome c oxidase subunit 3
MRQILVDLAAWYWHSMGALWVILFALLAFCQ